MIVQRPDIEVGMAILVESEHDIHGVDIAGVDIPLLESVLIDDIYLFINNNGQFCMLV
jgi:hypothetical protein